MSTKTPPSKLEPELHEKATGHSQSETPQATSKLNLKHAFLILLTALSVVLNVVLVSRFFPRVTCVLRSDSFATSALKINPHNHPFPPLKSLPLVVPQTIMSFPFTNEPPPSSLPSGSPDPEPEPAVNSNAIPSTDPYPLTADKPWGSLIPPQRGFVRLGPKGDPAALAVWHQLHCVNGIRFAYVAAREGLFDRMRVKLDPNATAGWTEEEKEAERQRVRAKEKKSSFAHAEHCFDLLRLGAMCRADSTLIPIPPPREAALPSESAGKLAALDLETAAPPHTRMCRDASTVRGFVTANQAFWKGREYDHVPGPGDDIEGEWGEHEHHGKHGKDSWDAKDGKKAEDKGKDSWA